MGPNQFFMKKKSANNQENELVKQTFRELFKLRKGRVRGIKE